MSELTGESQGKVRGWFNKLRNKSTTPIPEPSTELANQKYDRIKAETQNVTSLPNQEQRANILLAHAKVRREQQAELQKVRAAMAPLAKSSVLVGKATHDNGLREFDTFMGEVASGIADGKGGFLSRSEVNSGLRQAHDQARIGLLGKLRSLSQSRTVQPPIDSTDLPVDTNPQQVRPLTIDELRPRGSKLGRFFSDKKAA